MANGNQDGQTVNIGIWTIRLIYAALSVGVGNTIYTTISTEDRFYARDFATEIEIRDYRLADLENDVESLQAQLNIISVALNGKAPNHIHPPENVENALNRNAAETNENKKRIHELELELARLKK